MERSEGEYGERAVRGGTVTRGDEPIVGADVDDTSVETAMGGWGSGAGS